MARGLAPAVVMLVLGLGSFVAAGVAGPTGEARKGGTLRMSTPADVDFIDPALAYRPRSWLFGYATCAKLFNYPDAAGAAGTRLVEEVVDRTTISRDGRTYTFGLKPTFRFHTGAPVTAQSFAAAFNRVANPKLGSPAVAYMREIVGAAAVMDGKATSISGVRVLARHRLQIRLTKPVGDFTARLTLPFFCPILPGTPADREIVTDPPGSGPYYVSERIVNQRIVLKRNPYYRGDRPANVDQVIFTIMTGEDCLLAVEQQRLDHCKFGLPETSFRGLAEKYGVNEADGQYFVNPQVGTEFLAFNHERPAFRGSGQIPLKKAINYAIDRHELARAFGHLASRRTDQLLPPALARLAGIYPLAGSDYATARKLVAQAKIQPAKLVFYTDNFPSSVMQAQILAFNLKQIGIDLQVKIFDTNALAEKITARGEPYDLVLSGWFADYADPASFFVPIFGPGSVAGVNLQDPRINARIEAANRLTGEARRKAWADLDVDLMRTNPPYAPFSHPQARTFVSKSLGCFLDHPIYGLDIAVVCKK